MYSQIGIQNSNSEPTRIPPAIKLLQARYASSARIEPLQIISNVVMQAMYNETDKAKMGSIPYMVEGLPIIPETGLGCTVFPG